MRVILQKGPVPRVYELYVAHARRRTKAHAHWHHKESDLIQNQVAVGTRDARQLCPCLCGH